MRSKSIFFVVAALAMLVGVVFATAPAFQTQTTPTVSSPAKLVTWTSVTSSTPVKYNVSMEGFQTLLINTTRGTKITIPKGVGQTSVLGDLKQNVTANTTWAFKLETARFEQENGTILVYTNQTVKAALINLHPQFY